MNDGFYPDTGGIMIKRYAYIFMIMSLFFPAFGGDLASLVELGFSADNTKYVFAQYGSLDKKNEAYAYIYTVGIVENDYIDEGTFFAQKTFSTVGQGGKKVYDDLLYKNRNYFSALHLNTTKLTETLYLKPQNKQSRDEIIIKDFEKDSNPFTYHIRLVPWYSGTRSTSQSSFYIILEKWNKENRLVTEYVIGNPDIKRRGVVSYTIDKIVCSDDHDSFVFIIEKKLATDTGTSIRYMVETFKIPRK